LLLWREPGVLIVDQAPLSRFLLKRYQEHRTMTDGSSMVAEGERLICELGIDARLIRNQKRASCRVCMDWSERRHHLAGAVGAALFERIIEIGWAVRDRSSRAVYFRPHGERAFRECFHLNGVLHEAV
jgi:hypothetical protein